MRVYKKWVVWAQQQWLTLLQVCLFSLINPERTIPGIVCLGVKGDQVLWIALAVSEHNKCRRTIFIIHQRVICLDLAQLISVLWRRPRTLLSSRVFSYQHFDLVDDPLAAHWCEVWILGVFCERDTLTQIEMTTWNKKTTLSDVNMK